jgi:hypothetical protein
VEVSPPFDGGDDGGDTVPSPIDEFEEVDFPVGTACETVTLQWETVDGAGTIETVLRTVFGIVQGQRIQGTPGNFEVFITCQGDASTGCIPVQELNFFSYQGAAIAFIGVV